MMLAELQMWERTKNQLNCHERSTEQREGMEMNFGYFIFQVSYRPPEATDVNNDSHWGRMTGQAN